MSKGGFALLSLFYKIDRSAQKLTTGRIHSFDIRPARNALKPLIAFLFDSTWAMDDNTQLGTGPGICGIFLERFTSYRCILRRREEKKFVLFYTPVS